MIFSKALLGACFSVLGFLCLLIAALLAILALANGWRGEPVGGPLAAAVGFALGGLVSRFAAARISGPFSPNP